MIHTLLEEVTSEHRALPLLRTGGVCLAHTSAHHLAAISMAAVYTDAVHIADGVVGLKQRSLAASDPTE